MVGKVTTSDLCLRKIHFPNIWGLTCVSLETFNLWVCFMCIPLVTDMLSFRLILSILRISVVFLEIRPKRGWLPTKPLAQTCYKIFKSSFISGKKQSPMWNFLFHFNSGSLFLSICHLFLTKMEKWAAQHSPMQHIQFRIAMHTLHGPLRKTSFPGWAIFLLLGTICRISKVT